MSTIFLIRHGESETNNGLPTAHLQGDRLTARGIEQARQIADYLYAHTSLDLIVTSNYQRTKETAKFTSSCFPKVPVASWKVQEFTYLSSLHHEVSTREQRKPLVQNYWNEADPYYINGPGSESFEAFIKRAYALLEQLRNKRQKNIAIFCHEQFITAVRWIIDCDPKQMNKQTMLDFKDYLYQKPISHGDIIRLQASNHYFTWEYERVTDPCEPPLAVQREPASSV